MSDNPQELADDGEFPPYDETPFAVADAEMPADAYSEAAADDEAPIDDEGCPA